ncbi:FAD-binding oxidoreductase [Parvibaculum lavamentivorans]|nr:FAD-binding oxidoreductase [Rhodobiaceae bacterium]MBN4051772.1 FAD-binding oxidoreductase [Parvibaculum lavamentivorans]
MTRNAFAGTTHPQSYYAATMTGTAETNALEGDLACDVCIIGAGYTGLSAALHLAQRGYDVVVLEAARIGWGASGRNGGQLGTTHRKDQAELEKLMGIGPAGDMWALAQESVATVKSLIKEYAIECDLTPGVLHAAWKKGDMSWLREEPEHMASTYGYDKLRIIERDEIRTMVASDRYWGGVLDENGAHLHPLNYALGIARAAKSHGARIFEQSRVLDVTRDTPAKISTAKGTVTAKQVVLACNGYLGNLDRRVSDYIMPINNFIIATEPLGEAGAKALIRDNVAIQDTKFVVDYYRLSADGRLLFGGGENYSSRFPRDIASFVKKPMLRVFPQLKDTRIDYAWGGTLAITMKRLPQFGRLAPNMFYGHGYSGQGINIATLGGKLLAEAVAAEAEGTGGAPERFDLMAGIKAMPFPGGTLLRYPGLVAGMLFYALKDRLP